jgi:hypothetical protein
MISKPSRSEGRIRNKSIRPQTWLYLMEYRTIAFNVERKEKRNAIYLWKLPVSRLQATTLLLVVRPKGEPVPPYTTITPLNIRADVKRGIFWICFFLCIIFNTASSAAPAEGGTGSAIDNHHPSEHHSRRKRGIF